MTAGPAEHPDEHERIHLGGETAVIVPLAEYRELAVLRDGAAAEDREDAAVTAAFLADKAAGRVRGVTDDELDAALDRLEAGQPWVP